MVIMFYLLHLAIINMFLLPIPVIFRIYLNTRLCPALNTFTIMQSSLILVSLISVIGNALCALYAGGAFNSTSPKDMYVVHATVYQVGILTNKTDGVISKDQGHQEAITFYRNNGSTIDLSNIRNPLLTNVTAQSLVGVAPVVKVNQTNGILPWTALENLASLQPKVKTTDDFGLISSYQPIKTKRAVASTPVNIIKGTAAFPPENGIKSLALPPLLALNRIPVPIPNTSIVRYAKINTLVKTP